MKKINFRQIFTFLLFFGIYMLSYIFIPVDKEFYNSLNKINIPPIVFIIVWTILYLLLSYVLCKNFDVIFKDKRRVLVYLIINYLSNFLFMVFMFKFHLLFWAFVMCIFSFVSILFCYMEMVLINKKHSYLIIPNVIWSLFGTILSIVIYLLN